MARRIAAGLPDFAERDITYDTMPADRCSLPADLGCVATYELRADVRPPCRSVDGLHRVPAAERRRGVKAAAAPTTPGDRVREGREDADRVAPGPALAQAG